LIINRILTIFYLFMILSGCGGGSGGSTPQVTSTEIFNLNQAWTNYLTASQSLPFSVKGTLYGVAVTGNGTFSQSGLQATYFENKSVLRKSSTASLRIRIDGENRDLAISTAIYVDSNYKPVGSDGDEYGIVFDTVNIPATAKSEITEFGIQNRYILRLISPMSRAPEELLLLLNQIQPQLLY